MLLRKKQLLFNSHAEALQSPKNFTSFLLNGSLLHVVVTIEVFFLAQLG